MLHITFAFGLMRRHVAGSYDSFGCTLSLPYFVFSFGCPFSSAFLLCTSSAFLRFLALSSSFLFLVASSFIRTANILSAILPAQVI